MILFFFRLLGFLVQVATLCPGVWVETEQLIKMISLLPVSMRNHASFRQLGELAKQSSFIERKLVDDALEPFLMDKGSTLTESYLHDTLSDTNAGSKDDNHGSSSKNSGGEDSSHSGWTPSKAQLAFGTLIGTQLLSNRVLNHKESTRREKRVWYTRVRGELESALLKAEDSATRAAPTFQDWVLMREDHERHTRKVVVAQALRKNILDLNEIALMEGTVSRETALSKNSALSQKIHEWTSLKIGGECTDLGTQRTPSGTFTHQLEQVFREDSVCHDRIPRNVKKLPRSISPYSNE